MSTDKITFLFNWRAIPYHAPVYLAKAKGFFAEQGISVALLSPQDPSDVTEIIGSGKVDMGAKAMIHTIAGRARGFPIKSVGTMMDEPFTGLIYLEKSGITSFKDIKGRKIGYVGEFGKIQLDELTRHFGLVPSDYEAVRCGMNITSAIQSGKIDAGIGLENVQMVELEEWLKSAGEDPAQVKMLRIDELAELGCCCFCSILYIANDTFIANHPEKIRSFMRAVKQGSDYLLADPAKAWAELKAFVPEFNSLIADKIFERSLVYMSRDLANVPRDWSKVTSYSKRLGIVDADFEPNCTNGFLSWEMEPDVEDPLAKQSAIAEHQRAVAVGNVTLEQSAKGPTMAEPSVAQHVGKAVAAAA